MNTVKDYEQAYAQIGQYIRQNPDNANDRLGQQMYLKANTGMSDEQAFHYVKSYNDLVNKKERKEIGFWGIMARIGMMYVLSYLFLPLAGIMVAYYCFKFAIWNFKKLNEMSS